MKRLFLITIDAKLDRKSILDFLSSQKGFGLWFYSTPSSFFIYSSFDAKKIAEKIGNQYGQNMRIFVADVNDSNYYGVMPKEHWNIVNNKGADVFNIEFSGYYIDVDVIPHKSGLYCVYRCVHNLQSKTVDIKELLYIGQAENLFNRMKNHEKFPSWKSELLIGEKLCYSYASVNIENLNRSESALIYINKPKCNTQGKDAFLYLDTRVILTGATALLSCDEIAEQTK